MSLIRALLVAENVTLRSAATFCLTSTRAIEVVRELAPGPNVLAEVSSSRPDVVVLYVSTPLRDGLDLLVALRVLPTPPVLVVVTESDHPVYRDAARKAGAHGLVSEESLGTELVPLLRYLLQSPATPPPCS
jgi:DNA-binding NarL/FixJ family response regulator